MSGGGKKTPLNVVMPYGMGISLNEALDMSVSLYLTMDYLIWDEHSDLES